MRWGDTDRGIPRGEGEALFPHSIADRRGV
jgi:hypothetical protein